MSNENKVPLNINLPTQYDIKLSKDALKEMEQ